MLAHSFDAPLGVVLPSSCTRAEKCLISWPSLDPLTPFDSPRGHSQSPTATGGRSLTGTTSLARASFCWWRSPDACLCRSPVSLPSRNKVDWLFSDRSLSLGGILAGPWRRRTPTNAPCRPSFFDEVSRCAEETFFLSAARAWDASPPRLLQRPMFNVQCPVSTAVGAGSWELCRPSTLVLLCTLAPDCAPYYVQIDTGKTRRCPSGRDDEPIPNTHPFIPPVDANRILLPTPG